MTTNQRKTYRETNDPVQAHVFDLMREVASLWASRFLDMKIGELMSGATTHFWSEFMHHYEEPAAEVAYDLGARFAFTLIKRCAEEESRHN